MSVLSFNVGAFFLVSYIYNIAKNEVLVNTKWNNMRFSYWQHEIGDISDESYNLQWEDCNEKIDVVALALKEPILFYDEVGT